jgi:5-methylcytosine-specific restriction endonuclease McrA
LIKAGEKIDTDEIGDRDNWICHLCDEPIDQSLSAPHPGSKTLDHVIPLNPQSGTRGTHVKSNVKIAHWGCNCSKGNRPIQIAS